MEDENEDLMSIFNSGQEINFDSQYFDDIEKDEEKDDTDDAVDPNKNIITIEGEDPEDVDGEEDDNNEGDDSDDESSPNLYSSISDVLFEQGLLPSLGSSKDIKTVDDFTAALKTEIDNQTQLKLDNYLNNLDLEKIAESKKFQIELDSIDEDYLKDNLEVAKNMILKDYMNQGLTKERAEKQLRKAIDLGEDMVIEEALESRDSLKLFEEKQEKFEKERYQEQVRTDKIEQDRVDVEIRKFVIDSKEVIKGIPNTKALGDKVFKLMTEVVAKNPQTGELENKFMNERSKNPIIFDSKMYYLFELTNGFTDLTKIKTVATTSATQNLERVLRKTKFEDNGTPSYLQDPESYSRGFGTELVL
jgi:hypothetical protein